MKNEMIVGTSYARSYKEINKWISFFETLNIKLVIPNITLEHAVKKANDNFKYANEYCYTRKATLGEYVKLAEEGCDTLLLISRIDSINNPCNTTRYLAAQLNEFFKGSKRVIDCQITKENEKSQLYKLAKIFDVVDEEKIYDAYQNFLKTENKKATNRNIDSSKINLLFLGGAPFLFSFSNLNTPMTNFLVNQLNVNIIGPKNIVESRTPEDYNYGLNRTYNCELEREFTECFWPRNKILAAIHQLNKLVDGIILVRDKYCMGKMEEVEYFSLYLANENIPYLVVDYSNEAQTTYETMLETFVEMLEWRKKDEKHVLDGN